LSESQAGLLAIAPEQGLHLSKGRRIDQGRVLAGMHLVAVAELADVSDVAQHLTQVVAGKAAAAPLVPLPRPPAFGPPAALIQFPDHGPQGLVLEEEGKDGTHADGFGLVDPELGALGIDVVTQQWQAADPFAVAAGGGNLIAGPFGNELAFELGKGEEHVEDQPAHRGSRVQLLADRDEGHLVFFEQFHEAGEVEQGAAEAIDLVRQNAVDLAGSNVFEEALQGGPVKVVAREAAIIVTLGEANPALALLAGDVGLGRGPLRIQGVERLLQPLLGRFAGVNGTVDDLRGGKLTIGDLAHEATPCSLTWKNRWPLQCEPVMALATADKER
jgi:hypothetical protein